MADFDGGYWQVHQAAGLRRIALHHHVPPEFSGLDEVVIEGDKGRIQAGDAIGRAKEILGFFERRVRRMVGGNDVEDAFDEPFQQRITIRLRPQRRVHLIVRVVIPDVLVGEHQMVRHHFRRNLHIAAGFPPADGLHAELAGHVLDVNVRARRMGQANVAVDDDFLRAGRRTLDAEPVAHHPFVQGARPGQLRHLAVAGEKHPKLGGVLHRPQQHRRVGGGISVVGQHLHPERAHALNFRQLLALAVLGDAAGGVHRNAGPVLGIFQHGGYRRCRVEGRAGVRHHHHAGDAAVDGRFAARGDGFLVLKTGGAEVDVGIKHAGHQHPAARVDDPGAFGDGQIGTDVLNYSFDNQDIALDKHG